MLPVTAHTDLDVEPDLYPLYPSSANLSLSLSHNSGLSPSQKSTLIHHSLTRAALFADLHIFQFLCHDSVSQQFIDLNVQDEDGLVLVSVLILGFGSDSDRDVEREECVRYLIAEGADVNIADKAGWTPLHHAAIRAPPTLISHLLTHGCSPFTKTHRNLTALDIVTAYSVIPGREDVATFLQEAMRAEGWEGSRVDQRRKSLDQKQRQNDVLKSEQEGIQHILGISSSWWGEDEDDAMSENSETDEADAPMTPPPDFSSMLVFSPEALPRVFESLIIRMRPKIRNADPAHTLYMLARFACLTCDQSWLEELIISATDAIEEVLFGRPDDVPSLLFWMYNLTVWLHLMRCDAAINETCELLGSYVLIEEVLNAVFVFLIRFAERRIDTLVDAAILDHSPLAAEFESIQFESEWTFFRNAFSSKRRAPAPVPSVNSLSASPSPSATPTPTASSWGPLRSTAPPSPGLPSRPTSPVPASNTPKAAFSSLRQTISRARASSSSITQIAPDGRGGPHDIIVFMTALHNLFIKSGINPALVTQFWSQIFYWISCEVFNRVISRKRYLCRSRAMQISMNLGAFEEWAATVGLPRGIESHFAPVKELLHWLQCLSSMDDFANLIATIQTLKHLNPLQMRRAVRDYRYEVNESRMADDCIQYLAQAQKDWERTRVKEGVEALRREVRKTLATASCPNLTSLPVAQHRDRDSDRDSMSIRSSAAGDTSFSSGYSASSLGSRSSIAESISTQQGIDLLFSRDHDNDLTVSPHDWTWRPPQVPEVLGEVLDSRYMLPLILPSDPRMLGAIPEPVPSTLSASSSMQQNGTPSAKRSSVQSVASTNGRRSDSRSGFFPRAEMQWRVQSKSLRDVRLDVLQWIDGEHAWGRWKYQLQRPDEEDFDEKAAAEQLRKSASTMATTPPDEDGQPHLNPPPHFTQIKRRPSARSRSLRASVDDNYVPNGA